MPEKPPEADLSGYVPRLKERYLNIVVPALKKELAFGNVMEVPRVTKVVLNMGMGESLTNPKALESAERDLATITGQKPVITKAKKSIANFKIRQGMPIGIMVTLRGNRMYEFLDRLFNIALPRVRDFRGAPNNGFDGRGNYSMGVREQVIFPEVDFNSIDRIRSFQITVVTTARNDDASRKLLAMMGLAFSRERVAAAA
ncbi:MAG: ribosomal protein [Dehalococcoidia bacterium]|nr:ribosomal protein [Dehalococcoidia bacterium]